VRPKTPKKRRKRATKAVPALAPAPPLDERVLSLDSSSKACGWALFESGQLLAYGCYRQEGVGHGERLANFHSWLHELLHEWQPHTMIYEAPYHGRSKWTFGVLVRYVAIIEAVHFQVYQQEMASHQVVAAHAVKKAIGAPKGDHETNKKNVLLMINEHFGLNLKYKANDKDKKVSQDDEADAIALNWAWHLLNRKEEA
jgi:Holliday junction resolvasome RuvABC endonuclease subunit